ncbi:Amt family ammonium transporter [Catenulispora sp. GAS73]|uniref:ammonium transporter n=1 Tax=Catenulispora sp. GAS73 TaxID=3156269 RepID=UPI0035185F09
MNPYPPWLNAGDNAWQLTAATLVGLMSLPGIAVLYGGLVQKKWAVNTMLMAFSAFSLVLIVWVLWAYNMGFGKPMIHASVKGTATGFIGHPGPVLGSTQEQGQATIPLLSGSGGSIPDFRFPKSSLVYFQFVFAAITPLLFLGSVVGRMSFKAWLLLIPLWTTFVYSVNAFLLWGGGWWAAKGALDYSGGYVIHLAAGTSGFVAAAVIGPRLARDRQHSAPNNLLLCATGAGILWLGWNGFNGGDPYFAGADAATAVINTNLATATALLTWLFMDMLLSPQKKPTLLGSINGMIVGLVAITPAAGFVNGMGAIAIGAIASAVVWASWYKLSATRPFKKVDDALGVVHTHGVAGLTGGLLVGIFADPKIIVYPGGSTTYPGLAYGRHSFHSLLTQLGAGLTIIVWDGTVTFLLLKLIGMFVRLRLPDAALETGDIAVHEEEVYPADTLTALAGAAPAAARAAPEPGAEPAPASPATQTAVLDE